MSDSEPNLIEGWRGYQGVEVWLPAGEAGLWKNIGAWSALRCGIGGWIAPATRLGTASSVRFRQPTRCFARNALGSRVDLPEQLNLGEGGVALCRVSDSNMNHADWSAALRAKIVRLRDIADNASDEEVRAALREIAVELEGELAFVDRKYG